jgi:hypothetical protein
MSPFLVPFPNVPFPAVAATLPSGDGTPGGDARIEFKAE